MTRLASLARHALCACTMHHAPCNFGDSCSELLSVLPETRAGRRRGRTLFAFAAPPFPPRYSLSLWLRLPALSRGSRAADLGAFSFLGRGTSWHVLGTRSERACYARAETLECCAWAAGLTRVLSLTVQSREGWEVVSSLGFRRVSSSPRRSLPTCGCETMRSGTTLPVSSGVIASRPKRSGRGQGESAYVRRIKGTCPPTSGE